jgi:hypothetical protein
MKREQWKKCPLCGIFTDIDEKYCPRYGRKEGHELQIVELSKKDIKRFNKKGKILTKHIAALEQKLFQ